MALELNEVIVPYKEFYGPNTQRMPELLAEGRIPLSTAGIMERRVNSSLADWRDNYFDSADAIVYHPDGKFKIVRDSEVLKALTPQSRLVRGALALEDGAYEALQGAEFGRKDKGLILSRDLTSVEAYAHPIWQALVGDQKLLGLYVDAMFPEMKKRFDYDNNMGVYLADAQKVPTARALYVDGLGGGSRLSSGVDLDDDCGRLVGVAPEALGAPGKVLVKPSLETALSVVNESLLAGKRLRVQ